MSLSSFTGDVAHLAVSIWKLLQDLEEIDLRDKQKTALCIYLRCSIPTIDRQGCYKHLDIAKVGALCVHVKRNIVLSINNHTLGDVKLELHFALDDEEELFGVITLVVEHIL